VQSPDWPDEIFWKPDGSVKEDSYRQALGFPLMPGLLERAQQPFQAAGSSLPWIGCHGNHEEVCQGVGLVNRALRAAAVGSRKPFRLPDGIDFDAVVETFVKNPEAFMSGPYVDVTPDRDRRPFVFGEFLDMHLQCRRHPAGHGFTEKNAEDGSAYYVYDTPAVRFITLDTACSGGGATVTPSAPGSISSAARDTLSGGTGGGGTPAPSTSFRVTSRIQDVQAYNPSGYYAVSYTYVIGGSTYHPYGTPKVDVANGPADVGACVTVIGTVINGVNYFTKIATELQSLCP